ncbi:O-antigen ligase family protein [uncultured Polaribacter sp.]|uniref:O-antigen ligase family protein n=1 Tax=uncultured Polaribacter sp. TaxID=174711 RepID=UPI00263901C9|nr:O-antigen ligase family protein [uncultured Polaribacter sp.]
MLKINFHTTLFTAFLIIVIAVPIFQLHYLLFAILSILCYAKVSQKIVEIIVYLSVILIIALIASTFNFFTFYDWLKDFAYLSKPILAILAGFLLAKKINNFKRILKIIVAVSLLFAVIHLFKIIFFVDFSSATVSDIRRIGGLSNEIEILAIAVLLISFKIKEINIIKNPFYKKIIIVVLLTSFCFYFSRTMLVTLFLLLLAAFGYLKITSKGLKYGALVLTFFALFYAYLFNADIKRGQSGFESFLYKMKNAPAEVFSPAKSIDKKNHKNLWDRWRAYEANMALSQMSTYDEYLIGKGLGSLVDLEFAAPLGEKNIRYIPILHNGYVNILFKSGVFGLVFYLLLLFSLSLFSYKKNKNSKNTVANNLIGGLAIHYVFTTLIVTGIYNNTEPYAFILGVLLYQSSQKE